MASIKLFLKTILLKPLYNLLMFLVFILPDHSLGFAVIILTVVIRVALLSSTKSMTRQQALMTKLKPEMDAIKEKYKDDQPGQAKALMDFYKKHKINPVGSCLPMIIQLLVLFALYYVFEIGVSTARFDLLYSFVPHPPVVNANFFGINLAKPDHLFILPIIAGIFQFIQTFQMLPKNKNAKGLAKFFPFLDKAAKKSTSTDPMASMQSQMAFVLPLVTVFVSLRFPAALPLYWAVSSLISIIQQHFVLKQTDKVTVEQADEILESNDPEKTLEADIKKNEKTSSKKGVTVTVRQKK